MEILSLDEIPDWKSFEDLVAAYFKAVKQDSEFNVIDVVVQQTGTGADGGRDILVKLVVDDSIMTYERIWIVQCKFHKADINKKHLADINIPSLLHEYGAHGYLLVCKNSCTAPVSNMFEGFNSKCHLQRKYEIWNGNSLLQRVRVKNDLIGHFFPRHYAYLKQKEAEAEQILKQHE